MTLEEYRYDGRIWQPHPTTRGPDSFFHAVFGEGQPIFDRDAAFRRRCVASFFIYIKEETQPEQLEHLKTLLDDEVTDEAYENYTRALPDSAVSIKTIPVISALLKVRVVVFVENQPIIFHPEEGVLGHYPWEVKDDLKEAVIYFNGEDYTRLQFVRFNESPVDLELQESMVTEEEDNVFYTEKYSKLSGSAGIKGIFYQINLLTIFLLNGIGKFTSFRLSTENEAFGKFDDVVLETLSKRVFLLQAKTKQNKAVYQKDLFSTSDGDFSLVRYYLSYQEFRDSFNVDALYLCTNTEIFFPKGCKYATKQPIENDDLLYIPDMENYYYAFNSAVIPQFRETAEEYIKKNSPNGHHALRDDDINNFFSKFKLVSKYPSSGNLETVIENLLCQRGHGKGLQTRNCVQYLNDKMLEWYDQSKGKYLNQKTLQIFLAEFSSNSFCEKLYNFQIRLENEARSYLREKRLVHIKFSTSYVLNMVKVYHSLYGGKMPYIFVSPVEEEKAQIDMVRAFKDSNHKVLVACFKVSKVEEIAKELTNVLERQSSKKIILITGKNDGLAELLRDMNGSEYEEVFENITINDLTQESQRKLLKRVTHFLDKSI